MNIASYIVTP